MYRCCYKRQVYATPCAMHDSMLASGKHQLQHQHDILEQVLSSFEECTIETFVDGTLGAGGHSAALTRQHPEMHTLVGIDRDPTAHSIAEQALRAASVVHPQPLDIRQLQAGF